ncbi:MAG: hypothetical protein V4725_02305 [Bacteroidota bacterium]|nr:hypothetical protein [Ferruginibacter sp.]
MKTFIKFSGFLKVCIFFVLTAIVFYSCTKEDENNGDYDVNNSLTLFKLDNKNNNLDLTSTDTVASIAGVNGKYIPVSGAAGAAKGLETVKLELLTLKDSLLNSITLTSFFKPEYHVINSQLIIPASQKGKAYKIVVTVVDKAGATIGTKSFFGLDVVSCDPLPPCVVNNQITVILETPAGTPENEDISLFGSLNGWNRGDMTYKLHKNPDVANCYCVTVPFPPGSDAWQLGEIFIVRGAEYAKQAVKADGSDFIVQYANSDRGPIWKITVPKWRDR